MRVLESIAAAAHTGKREVSLIRREVEAEGAAADALQEIQTGPRHHQLNQLPQMEEFRCKNGSLGKSAAHLQYGFVNAGKFRTFPDGSEPWDLQFHHMS
ncbi:hypothetical protein BaRGS_00003268 [Batillaria attramentaria]|uniref:Uncharacterized protein n=1 Tax=Batillaria attramentaria TaxID=370345 RepID=A0ABD0M1G8_9CAEN